MRKIANRILVQERDFVAPVSTSERLERTLILQCFVPSPQRLDIGPHCEMVKADAKFVIAGR